MYSQAPPNDPIISIIIAWTWLQINKIINSLISNFSKREDLETKYARATPMRNNPPSQTLCEIIIIMKLNGKGVKYCKNGYGPLGLCWYGSRSRIRYV